MYRFMIIVVVLMCCAVSSEGACRSDKENWYNDPVYKCTLFISLFCGGLHEGHLYGKIDMYDADDGSDDDWMGSAGFAEGHDWIPNYPEYGTVTNDIRVVGRATDMGGGNVEPYLKIKHNCGGSGKEMVYRVGYNGLYLHRDTYILIKLNG